jgi:Tol biopolymer transport system component
VNLPRSGRRDIWYRRQVGDTTLKPLVELPGDQFGPRISPDGQWLAFYTNTAPSHVFVTSIPGPGPAYKVSVDAGEVPVWSPDGKRLYYLNGTNGTRILAATLQFTPSFAVTRRDTVLDGGFDGRPDMHGVFDVAPDGQRFALLERLDAEPRIIVVHDWKYEMREPERPAKK